MGGPSDGGSDSGNPGFGWPSNPGLGGDWGNPYNPGGGNFGGGNPGNGDPSNPESNNPEGNDGNPPHDGTNPEEANPILTDGYGNPIITSPVLGSSKLEVNLVGSFSPFQKNWWNNTATASQKADFLFYVQPQVINGVINLEALNFVAILIDQSILNPTLNFDVNASANSPANIDRSAINSNTPEGQRFNEIYDALKNVLSLRHFLRTFLTDLNDLT